MESRTEELRRGHSLGWQCGPKACDRENNFTEPSLANQGEDNPPPMIVVSFKSHTKVGRPLLRDYLSSPCKRGQCPAESAAPGNCSDPGTRYRKSHAGRVGSMCKVTDVICQLASREEETGQLLRATSVSRQRLQALMAGNRQESEQGTDRLKGQERLLDQEGNSPEKRDLCLPPNLGLMTVSCPLPGRPDAHGAMGGR